MNIQEYLDKHHAAYKAHKHPPAYTAQELAAEEHVSGDMFAKPVIVRTGEGFAMCVLPASHKLDLDKAGDALGRQRARLADETEMAKLFPDAEVGAEPPFGNLYDIPTVVDNRLAEDEEIVFQAGSHQQAIRMSFKDYERLVKPKVADLAVSL